MAYISYNYPTTNFTATKCLNYAFVFFLELFTSNRNPRIIFVILGLSWGQKENS